MPTTSPTVTTIWKVRSQDGQELAGWWDAARAAWLEARQSAHTRRAYEAAFRFFVEFCGDVPAWGVNGAQVMAWQAEMRRRGLAEETINLRLSALSSFYAFAARYEVAGADGQPVALTEYNPVARVERARVRPYGKSVHLDAAQVGTLLASIRRDSLVGLRDYALVATYFYTGRRSAEVRHLRWGDISRSNGRAFYDWQGKGGIRRTDELPLPAYDAIVAYLAAAGRELGREDYVFSALRLHRGLPLCSSMVNRIVKQYARRAGLAWERISTHTLRHSAAMLRWELSRDVKAVQDFLGHSSLATTQIYLEHAQRREDPLWIEVEALVSESASQRIAEG